MWKELEFNTPIDLEKTLFSGQVFNFTQLEGNHFIGNIYDRLCILKQSDSKVLFLDTSPDIKMYVHRFFNTEINTEQLQNSYGLRFITNDIIPTIFSFICSSNNNIKRITKMVQYLYSKGPILDLDLVYLKKNYNNIYNQSPFKELLELKVNKFPETKELMSIEGELLVEKFGYRSKFICNAANFLFNNKINWLSLSYGEARTKLKNIKGVGRKVADCICLISMMHFHVVPLDVHIFRVSQKEFHMDSKVLTDKIYLQIQDLWYEKYGSFAGIVQLYKFKESVDLQLGRKTIK